MCLKDEQAWITLTYISISIKWIEERKLYLMEILRKLEGKSQKIFKRNPKNIIKWKNFVFQILLITSYLNLLHEAIKSYLNLSQRKIIQEKISLQSYLGCIWFAIGLGISGCVWFLIKIRIEMKFKYCRIETFPSLLKLEQDWNSLQQTERTGVIQSIFILESN